MTFNESLFRATKEALLLGGANEELATNAAQIIASDNPNLPNLGRTSLDQEIINDALPNIQVAAEKYRQQ